VSRCRRTRAPRPSPRRLTPRARTSRSFGRLGATFVVEDPLPETPYTKDIPGGRQIAWGMALNKLKVLGKDQYKKVRARANRGLSEADTT
jgi:hypothetical protein